MVTAGSYMHGVAADRPTLTRFDHRQCRMAGEQLAHGFDIAGGVAAHQQRLREARIECGKHDLERVETAHRTADSNRFRASHRGFPTMVVWFAGTAEVWHRRQ